MPPDVDVPFDAVFSRFVVRHSMAGMGCVFNQEARRFERFKTMMRSHTMFMSPRTLSIVLQDHSRLPEATRLIADEAEPCEIKAPSIKRQCCLQRCAYLGMLIMVKLSQKIATDLLNEVSENASTDPFSPAVMLSVVSNVYSLTGDAETARSVVEKYVDSVDKLALDIDLPYRAECERRTAILMDDLELPTAAASLISRSIDSAERMESLGIAELRHTTNHFQRLLVGAKLGLVAHNEKLAEHALVDAMRYAVEIPPIRDSLNEVSLVLLKMPTTSETSFGLEALRCIATGSVAYHAQHYGKWAKETCTARNILANILLNLEVPLPPELHADILLGLQVLEGKLRVVDGELLPIEDQQQQQEATPQPAVATSAEPSSTSPTATTPPPTTTTEGADATQQPSSDATAATPIPQTSPIPQEPSLSTDSPSAGPTPTHKVHFAQDATGHEGSKKKFVRLKQVVEAAALRRHTMTTAKITESLKKKQKDATVDGFTKLLKLRMSHVADRETYWKSFCQSYLEVVEDEWLLRKQLLFVQEETERQHADAQECNEARVVSWRMNDLFTHFLTWSEHGNAIELFEEEDREKVALWERSDWQRIAVREEYLHRKALENAHREACLSHLLVRMEYIERAVYVAHERSRRQQHAVEFAMCTVRLCERREAELRQRWLTECERHARRTIWCMEECDQRRRVECFEIQERKRLISFMRFVGLEFALRGVEYFERIARGRVVDEYLFGIRAVFFSRWQDLTLCIEKQEVEPREAFCRRSVEVAEQQTCHELFSEEELLSRHAIYCSMLSYSLFAVEVYEYYVREANTHIYECETASLAVAKRRAYMELVHTPAIKLLEFEESRERQFFVIQRTDEASEILSRAEIRFRADLVAEEYVEQGIVVRTLQEGLRDVMVLHQTEFFRLEGVFRDMDVKGEECHRLTLLQLQEAAQRDIAVCERRSFLKRAVESQHLFFYESIEFQQHLLFISRLLTLEFSPLVHRQALYEEQRTMKSLHALIQEEIWSRISLYASEGDAVALVVTLPIERTVREQIMADWGRGHTLLRLKYLEGHHIVARLIHCEEAEYQQRTVIEMRENLNELGEWEPRARLAISMEEEIDLKTKLAEFQSAFLVFCSRSQSLLESFSDGLRQKIERAESEQRQLVQNSVRTELKVTLDYYRIRQRIAVWEVVEREATVRAYDEVTLLASHKSDVALWWQCAKSMRQFEFVEAREKYGREVLLTRCHCSSRALWELDVTVMWSRLTRQGIMLDETACRARLEAICGEDWELAHHRANRSQYFCLVEEERRAAVVRAYVSGTLPFVLRQEALNRGTVGMEEAANVLSIGRCMSDECEALSWEEMQPSIHFALECIHRDKIKRAETDSRHKLQLTNTHALWELFGRGVAQLFIREEITRLECVEEELFAAEALQRNVMELWHFSVFAVREEVNERHRRLIFETAWEREYSNMLTRFSEPLMLMVPREEAAARRQMDVEASTQFHHMVFEMLLFVHAQFYAGVKLQKYCDLAQDEADERYNIMCHQLFVEKRLLSGASIVEIHRKVALFHKISIVQRESLEFKRMLCFEFVAVRSLRLQPFLLNVLEPGERQYLELSALNPRSRFVLDEFFSREQAFRLTVYNRRDVWCAHKVAVQEGLARQYIALGESSCRASMAKQLLPLEEMVSWERIRRLFVLETELYWRKVILLAEESIRRQWILREHTLDGTFVCFCEFFIRCKNWSEESRLRRRLELSCSCSGDHLAGAILLSRAALFEYFRLVEVQESHSREVLCNQARRSLHHAKCSELFVSAVVPTRAFVEKCERDMRYVLYGFAALPRSEEQDRQQIMQSATALFDTLVRKEAAWRACVQKWEGAWKYTEDARLPSGAEAQPPPDVPKQPTEVQRPSSANTNGDSHASAVTRAPLGPLKVSKPKTTNAKETPKRSVSAFENSSTRASYSGGDRPPRTTAVELVRAIRQEWVATHKIMRKPPHRLPQMPQEDQEREDRLK